MATKSKTKIPTMALSVRQPFASIIMHGIKTIEFRSMPTGKRERVYIYASKSPVVEEYDSLGIQHDTLPVGVLIGTVEIIDCIGEPGNYMWYLASPKLLKRPIRPENRPTQTWFTPFKSKG